MDNNSQIATHSKDYFKLGFDENCLSLLPKRYPFLINPFDNQKIKFSPSVSARLKSIFKILRDLLNNMDNDHELILAYLNSLLSEINAAYFLTGDIPADDKLPLYIRFKFFVENNLTDHTPVNAIAEKLAVNSNNLYNVVKQYSGFSPKEFITNRLILEAKRRLYYSESSIKELAYDLGYNDPEYFSRLFKKVTGSSIGMFVQDLSYGKLHYPKLSAIGRPMKDPQKQRIKELEKQLEDARLKVLAYEKLISITEKEEGISILKKDAVKQLMSFPKPTQEK